MTDQYDDAARRTRILCEARGDTISGLRETLRLVMTVMALREFTPFARPMGEHGRPIEASDPYEPRPGLRRPPPRPGPVPGQRLPRVEEFRFSRPGRRR